MSRVPITALQSALGQQARVLHRRASAYATSHPVENLRVRLERGGECEVVFKDLSPGSALAAARGIRPAAVVHPAREILVYQHVLSRLPGFAPRFIAAATEEARGQYWLFVERVRGRPLWEHGRFGLWLRAAEHVGRLHAAARSAADAAVRPALLRHDRAFHASWLDRALAYRGTRAVQALRRVHARAIDEALARPGGLIHGECFASNVLVRCGGEGICLIDWESAAVGWGLLDLAALAAGWPAAQREAMCSAYASGHGEKDAASARAMACARLLLAVQMLGWSRRWRAPRAHRLDWLAEAREAASEVQR